MSLVCELAGKDGLTYFHTYSDDNFWVRKVGTTEVVRDGWDVYHIGDVTPEYEEIYENPEEEENVE